MTQLEREAERAADIWHNMSEHAREVVRMCNGDLLETLVEDT